MTFSTSLIWLTSNRIESHRIDYLHRIIYFRKTLSFFHSFILSRFSHHILSSQYSPNATMSVSPPPDTVGACRFRYSHQASSFLHFATCLSLRAAPHVCRDSTTSRASCLCVIEDSPQSTTFLPRSIPALLCDLTTVLWMEVSSEMLEFTMSCHVITVKVLLERRQFEPWRD